MGGRREGWNKEEGGRKGMKRREEEEGWREGWKEKMERRVRMREKEREGKRCMCSIYSIMLVELPINI